MMRDSCQYWDEKQPKKYNQDGLNCSAKYGTFDTTKVEEYITWFMDYLFKTCLRRFAIEIELGWQYQMR